MVNFAVAIIANETLQVNGLASIEILLALLLSKGELANNGALNLLRGYPKNLSGDLGPFLVCRRILLLALAHDGLLVIRALKVSAKLDVDFIWHAVDTDD